MHGSIRMSALKVKWHGKVRIDIKASNPNWKKWLPSWPTSAHWYDVPRIRRYMAAHIDNRPTITVREFISEFDGMTGTAKQKAVLAETGASHVSLHNFFGLHKANTKNIQKLLDSLKKHTKPVRPAALGVIGREHFYARMEAAGGDPKTFTYTRRIGEIDGIPRVIEFAFGIHSDGLTAAGRGPARKYIPGVNWSPGINNPFQSIGKSGEGLDAILENVRASSGLLSLPACMSRVRGSRTGTGANRQSWSRVKWRTTTMAKNKNMATDILDVVREGTKRWTRTIKSEERHPGMIRYRMSRMTKEPLTKQKHAAWEIMEAAYLRASANDTLPAQCGKSIIKRGPKSWR